MVLISENWFVIGKKCFVASENRDSMIGFNKKTERSVFHSSIAVIFTNVLGILSTGFTMNPPINMSATKAKVT